MVAGTPPPDGGTKSDWRRWARPIRDEFAPRRSAAVVHELRAFLGTAPLTILSYRAMPTEVDPQPVETLTPQHRYVLTRTPTVGGSASRSLTLHLASGPTERHRFGFEQPLIDATAVGDHEVDVVLVPGLAFDRDGNRLGHGQGYYDRLLDRLRTDVILVGVTIDELLVDRLPVESYDVAMTHVATQSGVHKVPSAP